MSEKAKSVTIMLNPRAKKVKLALRVGAIPALRAGLRRTLLVSELAKYADTFIDLAKSGALRAYHDGGLKPMAADEFAALLGGETPEKPADPSPKSVEEERDTTPPPPPSEDPPPAEDPPKVEEPTEAPAPKKSATKKRATKGRGNR